MEALTFAFGIDWKLLLAQALNFAILLTVLTYFLYKPVLKTITDRRDLVAQGVTDAEEAKKMLAGADAVVAEKITDADKQAEGIVSEARDIAGAERSRILKEAEERAARVEQDAEARAKETADRALRESEKEIARLAILAAEKAMRKEV